MIQTPICHAQLDWVTEDGVAIPVSRQFGDVYFSRQNGLEETRHVFLQGNDLPARLPQLLPYQYFCVGELGFGTGLNILALWQLWRQVRPDNHSRLHVLSVEKYPLQSTDLARALAAWPELAPLAQQLLAQYPPALPGCHRLIFANERFSIDLWLGDAAQCLPQIASQHAIDAWFLDGFAPRCNPQLWQDSIFSQIIRLSGVGTTFASFSVAGVLKQALRAHGISLTRPRGFGHKRQMLKAWWPKPGIPTIDSTLPSATPPAGPDGQHSKPLAPGRANPAKDLPRIAIIGAGIAGLSLAQALAIRGYGSDLYDQLHPLAGASGNPYALLAPKLVPLQKFASNLMNLGWLHSLRYWQNYAGVIHRTGMLHVLQKNAAAEQAKAHGYPPELAALLNPEEASRLSQTLLLHPAILFKQAALLNPHALAQHVLSQPAIRLRQAQITQLKPVGLQWQLIDPLGNCTLYDWVMVCNARFATQLLTGLPHLKPIRGQVSWTKAPVPPQVALAYGGYLTSLPAPDHPDPDGGHSVLLGASFVRGDTDTRIRLADHAHSLHLLQQVAPDFASTLPECATWQGRASIRAQSPDYLPLAGAMADQPNLWTLTGLGAKGFSFAPLCAEILCAQLLGEVCPVPAQVLKDLDPNRFASH